MSEKRFTPGPWKLVKERRDGRHDLIIRMGDSIKSPHSHDAAHAFTYYEGLDPSYPNKAWLAEVNANATLIAFAPDVYEAVDALISRHDAEAKAANFDRCGCHDCAPLRAALAKARGESSPLKG